MFCMSEIYFTIALSQNNNSITVNNVYKIDKYLNKIGKIIYRSNMYIYLL